jgi:hypothetical protein
LRARTNFPVASLPALTPLLRQDRRSRRCSSRSALTVNCLARLLLTIKHTGIRAAGMNERNTHCVLSAPRRQHPPESINAPYAVSRARSEFRLWFFRAAEVRDNAALPLQVTTNQLSTPGGRSAQRWSGDGPLTAPPSTGNWNQIRPFTIAAATRFVARSGLPLQPDALDRVCVRTR